MLGVLCRLHDSSGDDLGTAHLPTPIEPGDLVAVEHGEFRVVDAIIGPPGSPIGALVKVQPTHLHVVAA
jgi:hypothetical protein